jgi:hypothetical protein
MTEGTVTGLLCRMDVGIGAGLLRAQPVPAPPNAGTSRRSRCR